jgi:probable addiction module antidote protein
MTLETTKWDVTEHLDSPEAISGYLEAIAEEGDPRLLVAALGDVARALGMSKIARDAGLSRESLYRSLSADSRAEFGTIYKVLDAMNLTLQIVPKPVGAVAARSTKAKRKRAIARPAA